MPEMRSRCVERCLRLSTIAIYGSAWQPKRTRSQYAISVSRPQRASLSNLSIVLSPLRTRARRPRAATLEIEGPTTMYLEHLSLLACPACAAALHCTRVEKFDGHEQLIDGVLACTGCQKE